MNRLKIKISKRVIGIFVLTLCLAVFFAGFGSPSALAASIQPAVNPSNGSIGPGQNDAIQARINELIQKIAVMKVELKQLRLEMQSLIEQRQDLLQNKPQPPRDNSVGAKEAYEKSLAEWQSNMDALNTKIADKQQQINDKEAELAKLEKVKADLQRKLNR